ncbi:peritrophin-44 isoform X2 [Hyalella azteca]|nr:peritrophin-44 isoform X2 [Hyalella azteca]XP_047739433.1 peritrophin-44 isoform X2 [Hyalella azteca]
MEYSLLLSLLMCAMIVRTHAYCVASCDDAAGEGSLVQNPSNCFEFYVCSDPDGDGSLQLSDEALTCSTGMYFDDNTSNCEAIPTDGSQYCDNLCNPCDVQCGIPGTLIPDPYNCQNYYICLANNENRLGSCKEGEEFDYIKNVCSTEPGVCYSACNPCTVYCVKEGRVPDPCNCEGYIYCEPPSGYVHFDCPSNSSYEPSSNSCVEYTSPVTSCDKTCTEPSCPAA